MVAANPPTEAIRVNHEVTQDIRAVGEGMEHLNRRNRSVTFSDDKKQATIHWESDTKPDQQAGNSTGHYEFNLVTAVKNGRPQLRKPESLLIFADSERADTGPNVESIRYHLDSHNNWVLIIDKTSDSPPVPSTPTGGIGGAYSTSHTPAAVVPSHRYPVQLTHELQEQTNSTMISTLGRAAAGRPFNS